MVLNAIDFHIDRDQIVPPASAVGFAVTLNQTRSLEPTADRARAVRQMCVRHCWDSCRVWTGMSHTLATPGRRTSTCVGQGRSHGPAGRPIVQIASEPGVIGPTTLAFDAETSAIVADSWHIASS